MTRIRSDTEKRTINIATACDNDYAQHTVIFLKSLFAANPGISFRVFILVPPNFVHRRALERNLGYYLGRVVFLNSELLEATSLKISLQVTTATYFRLLLDRLVPKDIDRIIYMDSDILVAGPLEELWATDLTNYVIAAVIDPAVDNDHSVRERIGLPPTAHYCNAGVMLIDLCRWRSEQLGARAFTFAVDHPERITYWDQCAINHVVQGRYRELSKEWNFQSHHLRRSGNGKYTTDALRELGTAKIVHFTGQSKPWLYLNDHPMKSLYWNLLGETDWRNYRPPDRTGRSVLIRNLENSAPILLKAVRRARTLWRATVS